MGSCFCGIWSRGSSTDTSPTKKAAEADCGLKVGKFLNPKNIWTLEIKQEQANYDVASNKVLTLGDLILSSPAFNEGDHSQKQCSSRRVHPSFNAEIKQETVLHESKESSSVEMAMKTEEGGDGQLNSWSFQKSRSGKLKKRVSFRSPEVADVFIVETLPLSAG